MAMLHNQRVITINYSMAITENPSSSTELPPVQIWRELCDSAVLSSHAHGLCLLTYG